MSGDSTTRAQDGRRRVAGPRVHPLSVFNTGILVLFVGAVLAPDIVVTGACEEYRPMVETRVIEAGEEAVLFVINRGLYDYDLEITAKGYESVTVKSGMGGVVRTRLCKMGSDMTK